MRTYLLIAIFALILSLTIVSARWQKPFPNGLREHQEKFTNNLTFRHELRTQLRACFGSTNATCNETRERARRTAIGLLYKFCTNYSDILEKIEIKINNSKKLTAEEKANLTALLYEKEKKFEELCNKLNETSNATEVREIFHELKSLIKETREEVKVAFGLTRDRRVGLIIQRMTHLQEKLNRFLENYKGSNKEKIENLVEQFNSKIVEANASYQEAKSLWQEALQQIQNKQNASETIRQANAKMQEAQSKLKEAHAILMQIIREIAGKEAEKFNITGGKNES
ncbi:MAG: hypothetical protein QXQ82_00305 [Candidatus Pacearchaeota archaeon]